ncbi:hypothetical protein AB0C65_37765 [Nocardia sp. NPDC048505]|uniref:hypothetical protein n=1 Tax=Nocardia sp. NPDC048505 TaxID=3155756 RepID=UPI0033C79DC9
MAVVLTGTGLATLSAIPEPIVLQHISDPVDGLPLPCHLEPVKLEPSSPKEPTALPSMPCVAGVE